MDILQLNNMKKVFKILLVFVAIFFFVTLYYYHQMVTSKERQNNDIKECENADIISEQLTVFLKKESTKAILEARIQLIRKSQIIKDTSIKNNIENKNQYFVVNIPFNNFLKTDTIIVKTKDRQYKISDFTYSSTGGHWGMFGYLGDNQCFFDYNKIRINDKEYVEIK